MNNTTTKAEAINKLCGSATFAAEAIIEALNDYNWQKREFGERFAREQINNSTFGEKAKQIILN